MTQDTPIALVTGFPGFLGERLRPRLLELHPKTEFKCLVQSRFRGGADSELARLGIPANRASLVEGDITRDGLGIEATRDANPGRLDSIHHFAGAIDVVVRFLRTHRDQVHKTAMV